MHKAVCCTVVQLSRWVHQRDSEILSCRLARACRIIELCGVPVCGRAVWSCVQYDEKLMQRAVCGRPAHPGRVGVVYIDEMTATVDGWCCLLLAGVSLKIMGVFRCVEVEGTSWLAADMRLQCYTGQWIGCVSVSAPAA